MIKRKFQDEKRKREDRERKKAEVRARLEAAAASKKKKGFMTPERKKKLRLLLRRKAAEELKRQQEVKANDRRRIITQRTGEKKNFEGLSNGRFCFYAQIVYTSICSLDMLLTLFVHQFLIEFPDQLLQLAHKYHERIAQLEQEKYDLEYAVNKKDYEITEMASKVNDMRGKL